MEKEYNTLEYYNSNAKSYFENTIKGDLQENYNRFLSRISKGALILDFGCGSGRDSKYFLENGYKVETIDGSKELCKLASEYIEQDVKCMKIVDYFETVGSTKRSNGVIRTNYIIQKVSE